MVQLITWNIFFYKNHRKLFWNQACPHACWKKLAAAVSSNWSTLDRLQIDNNPRSFLIFALTPFSVSLFLWMTPQPYTTSCLSQYIWSKEFDEMLSPELQGHHHNHHKEKMLNCRCFFFRFNLSCRGPRRRQKQSSHSTKKTLPRICLEFVILARKVHINLRICTCHRPSDNQVFNGFETMSTEKKT